MFKKFCRCIKFTDVYKNKQLFSFLMDRTLWHKTKWRSTTIGVEFRTPDNIKWYCKGKKYCPTWSRWVTINFCPNSEKEIFIFVFHFTWHIYGWNILKRIDTLCFRTFVFVWMSVKQGYPEQLCAQTAVNLWGVVRDFPRWDF